MAIGKRARKLRGVRRAGGGVRFRRTRQGAWVYGVKGGRVTAVAVASRKLAANKTALRAAMQRLLTAKASPVRPTFVPSTAEAQALAAGGPTGKTLAGTSSPRLNAALALLCGLGVHSAADAPGAAPVALR